MNLTFDLKYAWRLLIRSWGYSLMCATVVALSVGLAVWTNALAYSQAFKQLEFPGAAEWYSLQIAPDASARARAVVDAYTYQELLKRNRSAEHLGAFASEPVILSEGQTTTSLRGGSITPRLLAATRVTPLLGRIFNDADGLTDAAAVAILSFDTWQNYFAADPRIIGRTVRVSTKPVQIVGVLPRDLLAFQDSEIWQPLQTPTLSRPGDSTVTTSPLVVLRKGQSIESIENELKAAVDGVNADYPRLFNAARHPALIPAGQMFTHGNKPIVFMMSLMALAVLLLGGVNISMVFLARLLERSRELALRTALGAARSRLLRQSLLETSLVVLLGLVAGYGLAVLGMRWVEGISAFGRQIFQSGRSGTVPSLRPFDLVVAILAAMTVWLVSTLIPALRIARQDPSVVLAGSGKGSAVQRGNKSVALLVGLQVVISCLVLVTCGNVVLAVRKETSKPTGLTTEGVILSTNPTVFDARHSDSAQRLRYWEDLTVAVESKVPGAKLALTTAPPTRPIRVAASIEAQQGVTDQGLLMLPLTVVSENYFGLLDVSLRAGRLFDSTDNRGSLNVAIVDEKLAARFWPDQEALGKRVQLNSSESWLTIVGVVSSVPGAPYRPDADLGSIYQPLRQAVPQAFHVLVKVPNPLTDVRAAIRAVAFEADRDLPLHNLQTLDNYLKAVRMGTSAMVPIFAVISLITAFLAASGLFGLIARSVAQRTQDVGIRRALGATVWRATSMFLRQGAIYLTVAFVAIGLGAMAMPLLSRAIPNILDHIVPVTLGIALLIAVVISTASYLPTRRAVALEPADALRYE